MKKALYEISTTQTEELRWHRRPLCHQKKVLISGLKPPWEQALKSEGKYSTTSLLLAPIIPQCERARNKSLYVHTDLQQPLDVQATVINQKFKINKLKSSFSSIMMRDQSKWISFLEASPGLKSYHPIYWQCSILFWRFGGRKGKRKKGNDPISQVDIKP